MRKEVVVEDMQAAWVEPLVARHLGRVRAPEDLWDHILDPERPRRTSPARRLAWAMVPVALTVLVALGFLSWRGAGMRRVEFASSHAADIAGWVKSNTGLDVPVRQDPKAPIRLVGASVVRTEKVPTAEIAYRVGSRDVALRVTKADAAAVETGHQGLAGIQGRKSASWTMRGQLYTLACATPEDLKVACLLCHAGA